MDEAGRRRIERTEKERKEGGIQSIPSSLHCQSIVRCVQATGRSGGHGSGSNDCRLKIPLELKLLHQGDSFEHQLTCYCSKSCSNEMKVINFTPQMPRTKTTINGRGVKGIGRRKREGESWLPSCSHSIRFHTLGEQRRRRRACPQDFPSFLFMDQTSKSASQRLGSPPSKEVTRGGRGWQWQRRWPQTPLLVTK